MSLLVSTRHRSPATCLFVSTVSHTADRCFAGFTELKCPGISPELALRNATRSPAVVSITHGPPISGRYVAGSGWETIQEMNLREAARSLIPSESGLPVDAVNQHKTLVAGLRL